MMKLEPDVLDKLVSLHILTKDLNECLPTVLEFITALCGLKLALWKDLVGVSILELDSEDVLMEHVVLLEELQLLGVLVFVGDLLDLALKVLIDGDVQTLEFLSAEWAAVWSDLDT